MADRREKSRSGDVWVFAELRGGKPAPVSIELLGEGRKLADGTGARLCAVLLGVGVGALADELARHGAETVYLADHPLLAEYSTDAYATVVADAIRGFRPGIFLLGATHLGRDLAPRVAARVGTGLTADCVELAIDPEDGKLLQTLPAFGGKLMATIACPEKRPQMATVRPGVMEKAPRNDSGKGEVVPLKVSLAKGDIRTHVVRRIPRAAAEVSLEDAPVIVAGGRGMGGPEGKALLEELAARLGGVVGASRAAVESGWADRSRMVGQTGTTVRPRLYIACGISGAAQHVTGMQGAEVIVAINEDGGAPIFDIADYRIVGDVREVVPCLLEALDGI